MLKTISIIMILTVFLSGCLGNVKENPWPVNEKWPVNEEPDEKRTAKHALLIGIENYRNVPPLRGQCH